MKKTTLAVLLGLLAGSAWAEAGRIIAAVGAVHILRDGRQLIGERGTSVESGDVIRVAANSNAQIRFSDESVMALRSETEFRIQDYAFEDGGKGVSRSFFDLIKGGLRTVTGLIGKANKTAYRIRTETATIGIRGTGFGLVDCNNNCRNRDGSLAPNGLYGGVVNGSIAASNDAGEREFVRGDFFRVGSRNTLPEPLLVPPAFLRDVVANRRSSGTPSQPSASTGMQNTTGSSSGGDSSADAGTDTGSGTGSGGTASSSAGNTSSTSSGSGTTTSGSSDSAAQISGLTAPSDATPTTTGTTSSSTTTSSTTSYQQTSELNATGQPAALVETGNTIVHSVASINLNANNAYSSNNETKQSTITTTPADLFSAFTSDPNKACQMVSSCNMSNVSTFIEGGKVQLVSGENVYWGVLRETNGPNTGSHFAYGVPTALQPTTGVVTFNWDSGSKPRDTLAGFTASGGTWQQGSLVVDFGARTLSTGNNWQWSLGTSYTRTYDLSFTGISYASGASSIQVVGGGAGGTLNVTGTSTGTTPVGSMVVTGTQAWISPSFIGTNAAAVAVGVTTLHTEKTTGSPVVQPNQISNSTTVGTASVQVFTRPR